MQWYWVDLVIVAIILLSVLTGLFRGFIKEVVALFIWVIAFWVAFHYANLLDPWFQNYVHDKTARTIVTFLVMLFATVIAGALVNGLLGFIVKRSGLSGTDRFLGMVFGLMRGIFIVALCMAVVKMTSLPDEQFRRESTLYAHFDPMVTWLDGLMPDMLNKLKSLNPQKELVQNLEEI